MDTSSWIDLTQEIVSKSTYNTLVQNLHAHCADHRKLLHCGMCWGYGPLRLFCSLFKNFGSPYYIVECAGVQAIVPILRLVEKLWLALLHCGMCRVQAIVPILQLVQKTLAHLTYYRPNSSQARAQWPVYPARSIL
jgi:hypothetical protein